jgi:hypothetical protein
MPQEGHREAPQEVPQGQEQPGEGDSIPRNVDPQVDHQGQSQGQEHRQPSRQARDGDGRAAIQAPLDHAQEGWEFLVTRRAMLACIEAKATLPRCEAALEQADTENQALVRTIREQARPRAEMSPLAWGVIGALVALIPVGVGLGYYWGSR